MFYGIDLGTSTCLVSKFDNKESPKLLKYKDERDYFNSIIKFNTMDEVIIGKDILNGKYEANGYLELIKSKLGKVNGVFLNIEGMNDKKRVSTQYCIALLLNNIKMNEDFSNENKVIITVPAFYEQCKRNATIEACKQAGIFNVELIEEPSAAVMYHLYKNYNSFERISQLINPKNILVFDFGGGTLDLSLIEVKLDENKNVKPKVLKVLGNNCLGGILIDLELASVLSNLLREEYSYLEKINEAINSYKKNYENNQNVMFDKSIDMELRKKALQFIKSVENLKKDIVKNQNAKFIFNNIKQDISIKDINEIIFKENGIERKIRKLINEFKVSNNFKIDELVLVGGSSKFPIIRDILREEFGNIKIIWNDKYINAVSYGASIVSAIKNGEAVKPFSINSCTGILSKNIYIKSNENIRKIVEYGIPYPTKESIEVDYRIEFSLKKSIEIEILEGLDEKESLNSIAKVNFYHPCFYTGDIILIKISIDESGLLSFSAIHKSTLEKIEFESKRECSLSKEKIEKGREFIKIVKYLN